MIIAIDGPSASGKGSLRRMLAKELGLPSLDTGVLYRALAKSLQDSGLGVDREDVAVAFASRLDPFAFPDATLRTKDMGELASRVSAHPGVRAALLKFQRDFADQQGGAVLDGRDIGTAVCPGADFKFFVTASAPVRAARRHRELTAAGETVSLDDVLGDIEKRDRRDSSRPDAPMYAAEDALRIDTTDLTPEETLEMALSTIRLRSMPSSKAC